jgi:hypothetical protein
MPAQDRVRPHEEQRPTFTAEHSGERAQQGAIVGLEARTRDLALQDGER